MLLYRKGTAQEEFLPQVSVNKVLWGPGTPEDTQADYQQLTAPRTQVQPQQARLQGQLHDVLWTTL